MDIKKEKSGYGESLVNYGEYLKVPEILRLQKCLSNPPHHDEMQFIIVHQAYELWFKLILHEADAACGYMREGSEPAMRNAIHHLRRIAAIQSVLLAQIHVLETMRPVDFLRFRDPLKPASGFQSTQFRELEFLAGMKNAKLLELCTGDAELVARVKRRYEGPTIWDVFCIAASKNGFPMKSGASESNVRELKRLYESPEKYPVLYELAEGLVEFDEKLALWRMHHIRMVERQIGAKPGTGAPVNQGLEGVRYLGTTISKHAFPDLWAVRSVIGE